MLFLLQNGMLVGMFATKWHGLFDANAPKNCGEKYLTKHAIYLQKIPVKTLKKYQHANMQVDNRIVQYVHAVKPTIYLFVKKVFYILWDCINSMG